MVFALVLLLPDLMRYAILSYHSFHPSRVPAHPPLPVRCCAAEQKKRSASRSFIRSFVHSFIRSLASTSVAARVGDGKIKCECGDKVSPGLDLLEHVEQHIRDGEGWIDADSPCSMCAKGKETQRGDESGCQAFIADPKGAGGADNVSGSISCRNYGLDGVITYNFTFANKRRGNKGVNRVHKCGLCREVHSRWCMKKHYADAHSGSPMPEAFELK